MIKPNPYSLQISYILSQITQLCKSYITFKDEIVSIPAPDDGIFFFDRMQRFSQTS